jgi:hypothetical protein
MTSYYLMVFFWIYISGKAAKLMMRPPKLSGARGPQHGRFHGRFESGPKDS